MARKIIIIFFSLAVIFTGAFAFQKLRYWERSVSIFSYKSFERHREGRSGRGDRGSGEFEGRGNRAPTEFESRNDRGSGEFEGRGSRGHGEFEQGSDRNRSGFEGRRGQVREGEIREGREGRANIRPGGPDGVGHGRGDYRRGKKIRLRNVLWFLAVFASFTAATIYINKAHIKILKSMSSRR